MLLFYKDFYFIIFLVGINMFVLNGILFGNLLDGFLNFIRMLNRYGYCDRCLFVNYILSIIISC